MLKPMKRLTIFESEVKEGNCSKCGRHKYLVKVVHLKTGETEWRCNRCVRKLRPDIAHKLTGKELEKPERFYGKQV